MSDEPEVDEPKAAATAVTLAGFLSVLVAIDTSLPKITALMDQADANPLVWNLPGMRLLKPYEQLARDWIPFLQGLDEAIIKALS